MFEKMLNPQNEAPKLALIVPCYNEQEALKSTSKRLLEVMCDLENNSIISKNSFIVFVDDGSVDKTFYEIDELHKNNKEKIKGIKFSKNFGNQNAILAGLHFAHELNADCCITIDADLQQDELAIKNFIDEFKKGNEIVFGIRATPQHAGFLKDFTAKLFYKIMGFLGAKIIPNHSEYRLVSKKALDVLSQYGENQLFLRGVFNEIGLKKSCITYKIKDRKIGKTKFNWASLTSLALNGITSFSIVPLRFVAVLGIIMALISFGFGLEVIYEKFILQNTIKGWATIVVAICFFSGIQIFCLGIIGEYLGQVFNEVKARPRYIKEIELI